MSLSNVCVFRHLCQYGRGGDVGETLNRRACSKQSLLCPHAGHRAVGSSRSIAKPNKEKINTPQLKTAPVSSLAQLWSSGDPPTDPLMITSLLSTNGWQATISQLAPCPILFLLFCPPLPPSDIQNHINNKLFSRSSCLFSLPQVNKRAQKHH